jgi:parvulin-like peptidyl-prolyl isomerase
VPPAAPAPAAVPAPTPSAAPAAAEALESIAAQHILIAYRGAKGAGKTITRSKADAQKRAEEVIAKVKGGEDFTALVKPYSDDAGSVNGLGNLGKFKRDAMVKPFSEAAFALKVNEVSGPVETPFGFHIIKRNQ